MDSLGGGIGTLVLRIFLALAAALALFGVYHRSQAPGLRSAAAMEHAQLARSIADGNGFTTRCIRPADTWYLRKNGKPAYAADSFPDVRNAPLYPILLSIGLRLRDPPPEMERSILHARMRVFAPEQRVVIPTTVLFTIATGCLVFLMGLRLFDIRVAITAAIAYLVTDAVLAEGLSGSAGPATAFFATAAVFLSFLHTRDRPLLRSVPLAAAGIACGLTFLARYAAIAILPVAVLIVLMRTEQQKWPAAAALVLIAAAVATPWLIRNSKVTGGPLGMASYAVLDDSGAYPDDTFDRSLSPSPSNVQMAHAVKNKAVSGAGKLYDTDLRTLGSGLIICFFLVSLFARSDNPDGFILKWATALGLVCLVFSAAITDANGAAILNTLLPLVTLCAVAFFLESVEKSEPLDAEWQTILTWALVLLTALPAICTIAGTQRRSPYPPYYPPFVTYVSGLLEPHETVCTDIPWATAWYGNRNSVLLPRSPAEFAEMNSSHMPVNGLYLTTETSNRGYADLLNEADQSWLPVLNRRVPPDFPLQHGIALPPGQFDQLFLTDRVRWEEEGDGKGQEGAERDRKGTRPEPDTTSD